MPNWENFGFGESDSETTGYDPARFWGGQAAQKSDVSFRNILKMLGQQWGLTPELQQQQFDLSTSRLAPMFEQQRRGTTDRLAAMGFGAGSGMELRGLGNVNRQQAQTFGDISSQQGIAKMLATQQGNIASQKALEGYLGQLFGAYSGADNRQMQEYLGRLGVQKARIQSGTKWTDIMGAFM